MNAEQAYLFRHALLRDAAYQLQMPADRAALHELALEIMERVFALAPDLVAEELADHARLAQTERPDAALARKERDYTHAAARYAEDRFLNEKAAALWMRAASLHGPGTEERVSALSCAGRLWLRCGRPEDSQRAFEAGASESAGALHAAALGLAQNQISMFQALGRYEEVLARGEALVARAKAAGNRAVELRTRYALVNARIINAPDYSPIEEFEPIAAQADEIGDKLLALTVRSVHGNSLRNVQRFAEAERVLRQCVEGARAHGFAHIAAVALGYLGHVLTGTRRHDEALAAYDECLRQLAEIGDRRFIGIFTASRGTLLCRLGRLAEACEHYGRAEPTLLEAGALEDLASVLIGRANVEFALGNETGWRNACAKAEAISNQLNQPQRAELARLRLAELEAEKGVRLPKGA